MTRDPLAVPLVTFVLTCEDGEVLTASFTLADLDAMTEQTKKLMNLSEPPAWLTNPRKHWDKPNEPVMMTAVVKAGHEQDAKEALGL